MAPKLMFLKKKNKYVFSFLFCIFFMHVKNGIDISFLKRIKQQRLKPNIEHI